MISDGIDSYELPIWSELYEQHASILKENQLVYAVLHVDRSNEDPKLSCKWIDDLTCADEKMIQSCDEAFDKAKVQISRFAAMKERGKGSEKKVETKAQPIKEEKLTTFRLTLDTEKTRLSHILQLKTIFEDHRGKSPVEIDFLTNEGKLASLQIDARWGPRISGAQAKA